MLSLAETPCSSHSIEKKSQCALRHHSNDLSPSPSAAANSGVTSENRHSDTDMISIIHAGLPPQLVTT